MAGVPDFRNVFLPSPTGDQNLDRSNREVSDGFSRLAPLNNGALIRSVDLTISASPQRVKTGLGRPWIGYIVCGTSVAANISADFDNRDALLLTTDADVTAVLWVF